MDTVKIGVVVGNGFSISYGEYSGLIKDWDSQSPLSWNIPCPQQSYSMLEALPSLLKLKECYSEEPDFNIFAKALDKDLCKSIGLDSFKVALEARHFLTIAFSHYARLQQSKINDCKGWSWYKWLKYHKYNICGVFSLNYDLLIESIFDDIGKMYYSLQDNHHGYGIPLVKPHGSVDFEIARNSISYTAIYPLTSLVDLNDTSIERLSPDDLLYPRRQPSCIIPNESNKYSEWQWVKPANMLFRDSLQECTHCIFIGISYFECDKEEIDEIIDHLPAETQIVVANPFPHENFLAKLKGRPHMVWKSQDGPVDFKGGLFNLKSHNNKLLPKCFCRSGLSYKYCCGNTSFSTM